MRGSVRVSKISCRYIRGGFDHSNISIALHSVGPEDVNGGGATVLDYVEIGLAAHFLSHTVIAQPDHLGCRKVEYIQDQILSLIKPSFQRYLYDAHYLP